MGLLFLFYFSVSLPLFSSFSLSLYLSTPDKEKKRSNLVNKKARKRNKIEGEGF